MNIELVRTCYACPEQYDVLLNEEKIGYLRLKHGVFRAVYPDVDGDVVYEDHGVAGDGMFYDEEERQHYLINAVAHLVKEHVLRGKAGIV
jgi:hypothetical protein